MLNSTYLTRRLDSEGHIIVFFTPTPVQVAVTIRLNILFRLEHGDATKLCSIMVLVVKLVNKRTKLRRLVLTLINIGTVFKQHVHIVKDYTIEALEKVFTYKF